MRKLFVLLAASMAFAGLLTATGSAAGGTAQAGACASQPGKMGRFSGIVHAQAISGPSCDPTSPLGAFPPLLWGGGPVMSGHVTITPIYWEPNGYFNPSRYRNLINQYLADVAAGSGSNTNVYSTALEYPGSNGSGTYDIARGTPLRDHNPLPKGQGCSVGKLDTSGIYADGSGYTACLDDAQITAEIQNVITANNLPQNDYLHEYVMLTPKHVESCFYPGNTTNKKNVCTINHYPSAGYCAYHTMFGPNYPVSGTVYANMPFPVYQSPVGFTCGTDAGGHGTIESPNYLGDPVDKTPTSRSVRSATRSWSRSPIRTHSTAGSTLTGTRTVTIAPTCSAMARRPTWAARPGCSTTRRSTETTTSPRRSSATPTGSTATRQAAACGASQS